MVSGPTKQSRQLRWGAPALILLSAGFILLVAPEERTLGGGITSVYLHVSLIWTGIVALIAAGGLGLLVTIANRVRWAKWAQAAGWVGLGFFAAGFGMSAMAAIVNWGGIFWQEPRNATALNVIAITLIVQAAGALLPPTRWRSLLHAIPAGVLIYGTLVTPLVLHPPGAARNATSLAIQLTFLSLFLLGCLAAVWIIWQIAHRAERHATPG